ncbi:spore germination protein GerPE [Halobacillus sp. A5]|uniref:spore germination protein GerPE n=1 Tax=Halobacillus sp. A5 TaxID=2880263 RepID=UPI0020A62E28|nr:spore germination protein GerPE [Halobacillus sp. A5]MCP3026721.1 spore germination protein GerPE [Halobacillus sp. A5]
MKIHNRVADIKNVDAHTVTIGSGLLIGDLKHYRPRTNVIAVQEETRTFRDWVNLNDYPIYQADLSLPASPIRIDTDFINHSPAIQVQHVHVTGISTAGLLQIGGIDYIDTEARLKHIRILDKEQ